MGDFVAGNDIEGGDLLYFGVADGLVYAVVSEEEAARRRHRREQREAFEAWMTDGLEGDIPRPNGEW